MSFQFRNKFASNVFYNKYAHSKDDSWPLLVKRLVDDVCGTMGGTRQPLLNSDEIVAIEKMIVDMKFIPGGRYLYYAGRQIHSFNNCALLKAEEDTREEWSALTQRAMSCLMLGMGIGVDYGVLRAKNLPLVRTGGKASGPIPLMYVMNEVGRNVMQGGSRRSAIYASLSHSHSDVKDFLVAKNWHDVQVGRQTLAEVKWDNFNFPAPLDMTNISVNYDDAWLKNPMSEVFVTNVRQALSTAEPGMSFNFGDRQSETLRNACQPASATVLTPSGISTIGALEVGDVIWSGQKWTRVVKKWSTGIKPVNKYSTTTGIFVGTDNHRIVENGVKVEVADATSIDWNVGPEASGTDWDAQTVMDGLVLGDGSVHKASNNLVHLLVGVKDGDYLTSEVASLLKEHRPGITSTAWAVETTIHHSELPNTYDRSIPDRFFYGSEKTKRSFLRGLFTANGSISGNRVTLKQSSRELIEQVQIMLSSLGIHSYITTNRAKENKFSNGIYFMKESYDLNITTGRSVFRDKIGFIQGYKQNAIEPGSAVRKFTSDIKTVDYIGDEEVFEITVEADEHTYWTGGCLVSNCCEVVSSDDSDVCNLGSVNLDAVDSLDDMRSVVELATLFLFCGTLRADLPFEKMRLVREKNRRIGLGLMGVHAWLLKRGYGYDVVPELHDWLAVYRDVSDATSAATASRFSVSTPVANRAIAPTGSIGILAGTTTGIEPLFAVAFKRRYLTDGHRWKYEYVVDVTADNLIKEYGLVPSEIDTAYSLSSDYERRIKFQADVQDYVDMAISSTINLKPWGSESNNEDTVVPFAETLAKYAPRLRGFTCYPDGARGGQPLTEVDYEDAVKHQGVVFEENDICVIGGKGGTCGS